MRLPFVIATIVAVVLTPVVIGAVRYERSATDSQVRLLLVQGEGSTRTEKSIVAAWRETARQVGVPFAWTGIADLLDQDPVAAARSAPAIVLPDTVAQRLPDATFDWMRSYVANGGQLLVVYDAGTRDQRGVRRPSALLGTLLGITYSGQRVVTGKVSFTSAAEAASWNIPPGKLTGDEVISGYSYGALSYPLADARQTAQDVEVAARSGPIPALATRRFGRGTVVWSALPLGLLRAYDTDALPIEFALQTLVTDLARIPNVVLAPGGGGGLVILWHVESNADFSPIRLMAKSGMLSEGVHQEFDITAGPYVTHPGDGQGFDACGKGRALTELLASRDTIGTDGGWAHNYFETALRLGQLSYDQIRGLVARNMGCLTKVTGKRIQDYTAPNGVYPQPEMTHILAQLGLSDYYYTGDSGGSPERAFWDGNLVSSSIYAFPVMTDGRYASLADMAQAHVSPAAVESWLRNVAEYVAHEQTIRLIYSHPHDLDTPGYASAFAGFLDTVASLQRAGLVRTEPMHVYTDFLRRQSKTQITIRENGDGVRLTLVNPQGLNQIAVNAPSSWRPAATPHVTSRAVVNGERTYTVQNNAQRVVLQFTT